MIIVIHLHDFFLKLFPGVPTIWAISRLFETQRVSDRSEQVLQKLAAESNIKLPEAPWTDNQGGEVVPMLKAITINISRLFYERASFNWPFVMATRLGYVGNSSMSKVLEMRDRKDDLVVAQTERSLVFVGTNSRKRVEIPAKRKEYLQQFSTKEDPLRIAPVAPPGDSFNFDIRVTASDTDMLYHVNQATWLQYCTDCAAEGISQGFFNHFKFDPFTYQVKETQILYFSEGFPGDLLTVSAWETTETKDTILFQIKKGDEQCAFCSFKFHKESLQGY